MQYIVRRSKCLFGPHRTSSDLFSYLYTFTNTYDIHLAGWWYVQNSLPLYLSIYLSIFLSISHSFLSLSRACDYSQTLTKYTHFLSPYLSISLSFLLESKFTPEVSGFRRCQGRAGQPIANQKSKETPLVFLYFILNASSILLGINEVNITQQQVYPKSNLICIPKKSFAFSRPIG